MPEGIDALAIQEELGTIIIYILLVQWARRDQEDWQVLTPCAAIAGAPKSLFTRPAELLCPLCAGFTHRLELWAGKAFGTFLRATHSCCSSQSTLTFQLNSSAVSLCGMTAFSSRLCYAYQLMLITTHTGLICEGVQRSINSYMERTEVFILSPSVCCSPLALASSWL